jgi:hypothetical protein
MKDEKVMTFGPPDTLDPSVIDEITMWKELLAVLFQGLPVPYNPAKMLIKVHQEAENNPEYDFEHLKKCCYDIAEIKEVKHLKPMIQEILNRILRLSAQFINCKEIKFNHYE